MVLLKFWVYRRWPAVATLPIGQVHQLVVTGTNAHPLHIHIQPFQITAFSGGANLDNGYFAVGDWHDTLLTASAGGGTTVTVRMQTDTFTGKAVVHCHILEHEDRLVTSVTSRRWYAAWHPFLGVAVRVRCGENHSKISSEHPSSQLTGYKEQHLWLNLFVSHDVQ